MAIVGGWRGDLRFGSEAGMRIRVRPDLGSDYVDADVELVPSDEGNVNYFQVYLWKPNGSITIIESNRLVLFPTYGEG